MASNYNLYLSSYKLKTTKLSYCGYTYYLSRTINGTKYYRCDERGICDAGLINKGTSYKPSLRHWSDKVHATHRPDFDKSEAEMTRGRGAAGFTYVKTSTDRSNRWDFSGVTRRTKFLLHTSECSPPLLSFQ